MLSSVAFASDERTLSSVAAADNFTYAWLPTEGGVVLTRPGLRIVLRAGRFFYEVNNATPIADRAPEFNGDDLTISPALAERLHQLAMRAAAPIALSDSDHVEARGIIVRGAVASRPITIEAKEIPGRVALALSGSGTPNAEIAIIVTGDMSKELPVVTIRRSFVKTDANGLYALELGYGLDAHKGTLLTVSAAYATGGGAVVTHLAVDGEPFAGRSSTLDEWPKN